MFTRECAGCGNAFTTRDRRKLRCKPRCGRADAGNAARRARAIAHDIEFIGVDGEGITTPDGAHHYVLLSCGTQSLHRDGAPLSASDCFEFLWDQFLAHPRATFVGFYLGYDFTQMLKTLPEDRAHALLHKEGIAKRRRNVSGGNPVPFPVGWRGVWEFDILGAKRFKLRKTGHKSWMYINDAGAFFQTSFLNAVNPRSWVEPVCTPEEYAIVLEGKEARSTATFGADMIRYNLAENAILARLMRRLNAGFTAAGVYLDRDQWFGPGQAAQEWMGNIGAPTRAQIERAVPPWALEAARRTYYGGWFEIFAHGPVPGDVYEYDINSAYPWQISRLPCLLHGVWTQGADSPEPAGARTLVMVRATVTSRRASRIGAMPHRNPDGSICRPLRTRGWMWLHELDAASRAGLVQKIEIHEWVRYEPCECDPPFAAIAELYQRRLQVGKNTPEGKTLKLLYNAEYGKMAQSVGSPKFSCAVYASLITAGCRTQILDAVATHPSGMRDIVMVATDGVYFRTPHPSLELSESELGKWDSGIKHNLSLFMPGVYWDDRVRTKIREGRAPSLKSRGIRAADLSAMVEHIDDEWKRWIDADVRDESLPFPTVRIPIRFAMVTATQALARGKWETAGLITTDGVRTLNADPQSKRTAVIVRDDVVVSFPYREGTALDSVPYDGTFGAEWSEDDELTPDGTIQRALVDALQVDDGDDDEVRDEGRGPAVPAGAGSAGPPG